MLKLLFFPLFFIVCQLYSQTNKVAIIGGGMSGVSAAYHILALEKNVEITLFEKNLELGGNAKTIQVKNANGQLVYVDLGPQYFAKSAWGNYLSFLEKNNLFREDLFYKLQGSFIVYSKEESQAKFKSPEGFRLKRIGLSKVLSFVRLYSNSRKVFLRKENFPNHLGGWLEQLPIKKEHKESFVLPFLASSLGTNLNDIKRTATLEIVKLYAFKPILSKEPFYVSKYGMGTLIIKIAKQLEDRGVLIKRGQEVLSVTKNSTGYTINSKEGNEDFNFVVLATHPYQAAKILNPYQFTELVENLNSYEYFESNIVIHKDSDYVNGAQSSFLNIETNKNATQINSNTMNLSKIDPLLSGIYKSWLKEEDLLKIKAKNLFIETVKFYHTLISPEFLESLEALKKLNKELKNIYIAGGWSEGLETQESAIVSGQKAANW